MSKQLRNDVIRLAHEKPEYREVLLPFLKEAQDWDEGEDDVEAGRKWDGPPAGYGKEYSSGNGPGKWEPASKGPGRHERDCRGYGQGGTENCYNKEKTKGLPPTGNKSEYNRAYRKKRWPDKYAENILRSDLIRLAHQHPEVRNFILPILGDED